MLDIIYDMPEDGIEKLKRAVKIRDHMSGAFFWANCHADCVALAGRLSSDGVDKNRIAKILYGFTECGRKTHNETIRKASIKYLESYNYKVGDIFRVNENHDSCMGTIKKGEAVIVVEKKDNENLDLCQYFGQKKLKDYATLFNSSSSFC